MQFMIHDPRPCIILSSLPPALLSALLHTASKNVLPLDLDFQARKGAGLKVAGLKSLFTAGCRGGVRVLLAMNRDASPAPLPKRPPAAPIIETMNTSHDDDD